MRRGDVLRCGKICRIDEDRLLYFNAKEAARKAVWEALDVKIKEFAEELESEEGNKFVRIAKQMVKDRRDVTGVVCVKNEGDMIVTDIEGMKEV